MSASADYNVSIVESFTPPANWISGQKVNKDVFAVNTGNVDAFVEESISGVLTITTEKAVNPTDNGKPTANSIKLTAAERYVIEAGSFFAYKPTNSAAVVGNQIVAMTPDSDNLDGYKPQTGKTDFTPDEAGLYVFRRKITVDTTNQSETFSYEGYYYDGYGNYYKISNRVL